MPKTKTLADKLTAMSENEKPRRAMVRDLMDECGTLIESFENFMESRDEVVGNLDSLDDVYEQEKYDGKSDDIENGYETLLESLAQLNDNLQEIIGLLS